MQIQDAHSSSQHSPPGCLMATLGLDLSTIEGGGTEIFETIRRRCTSCNFRDACELVLRQARLDVAVSDL
jgi:hypothetical protein